MLYTFKCPHDGKLLNYTWQCQECAKDTITSLREGLAQAQAEKAELVRQCAEIAESARGIKADDYWDDACLYINSAILSLITKE